VQPSGHLHRFEQRIDTRLGVGLANAMQRSVIGKVLVDAEIEIQCSRLKHDAEAAQRLAGSAADIVAKMRIAPLRVSYRWLINENSVVLPAPLSPSKTLNVAGAIAKDTLSSARFWP
jgi:hypothetical protein